MERAAHVRKMAALFDLVAPDYDQHVPFFSAYAEPSTGCCLESEPL